MNDQNMRFRIGVFVLSSVILLASLVMLFGHWPTVFKRPDHYVIIFQNAPGVEEGTPVRRSGVRIGQVQSVELDDATGRVRAVIDIDRPHPLYETDEAVLVHGILSGDTSIDFAPARKIAPDAEPARLQVGAELVGGVQADVPMLLNQTATMVPTAQEALNEIRATLKRYEKVAPLVEEALKQYGDLGKTLNASAPDFRESLKQITELSKTLNAAGPDFRETLKQYSEFGKTLNAAGPDFRDTLKNVKDAVPEVRALVKTARDLEPDLRRTNEEVQVAIRNWGRVGERVNVLLESNETKITETVDRVNQAAGRVVSLLSDENQKNVNETLRNFNATSKNLDALSRNFDDFLKEARQSAKQIDETIKLTEQVMANLQKATKPIADRSENLMKNLEELTDGLNKTLLDTRELLRIFSQSDGTLRRLLSDPGLYNNVNDTVLLLNRSLPSLDLILHNIEVFSDKLARHPELIGAGGIVHPSSGLKDSPFAPSRPRFGGSNP
jgi:phospholipid/cholesterol/gamma-HCH transport system substrate-binding protein